jgi:hypothetical protein
VAEGCTRDRAHRRGSGRTGSCAVRRYPGIAEAARRCRDHAKPASAEASDPLEVTAGPENFFDSLRTKRPDQLIIQIFVAHVEAELLQLGTREV